MGETGAFTDLKEDLRQGATVGRYEVIKFISGKKIMVFGIIIAAILALVTFVLFYFGNEITQEGVAATYVGFVQFMLMIGATLFSSVTIVSEFSDRTALILFTKPVSKRAIMFGKFAAAYIVNFVFLFVYYVITLIITQIYAGGIPVGIYASLGYAALYLFAVSGIATFFSCLMKKPSSASILTFAFILLVPSIFASILYLINPAMDPAKDLWYILDYASLGTTASIYGTAANALRDALVMIIWGLIPAVGGYYIFRHREL